MKILVCGGRDLDEQKVFEYLCSYLPRKNIVIIQGEAKGADRGAKMFAEYFNIPMLSFKADWDRYKKRAGYIRNQQMLDEGKPDIVIAFPGGAGTRMMVDIARKSGKKVIEIKKRVE